MTKVLLFFELRCHACSTSEFLSTEDCRFVPASNTNDVVATIDSGPIDACLVPERSIPTWWEIESEIGERITVPRFVFLSDSSHPKDDPNDYTRALGFDGGVSFKFDDAPRVLVKDLQYAMSASTTRGSRPPEERERLMSCPTIAEITGSDPINFEILAMVAIGRTNAEIGHAVFLAEPTVRNRVHHMLKAAHVRNRTELGLTYLHQRAIER